MRTLGSTPLAFPDFRGATRTLILANLATYFALFLAHVVYGVQGAALALQPAAAAHGSFWQPFTYSFVHFSISATVFELLSLWFLLGFLESRHSSAWVFGLYAASVLGAAVTAMALFGLGRLGAPGLTATPLLYGCFGGLFGLLAVIGTLHGDTEFLLFFTIGMKARYLAAIYALIAIATLIQEQQMYTFAMLGGGLAGMLYAWMAPRQGFAFRLSERWYGLINSYYRWKRRRAGRKFEVYMRSQGKTIHLDGYGKRIDDERDPKHWN
ncbi:MAG: rhomboid family intramembrane serine protease [Terracidiphilus sp.]|nr:rhomboid family intramembrane serine protease [Terracidiphilus sp.]